MPSFDGNTLVITLDSAVTDVNVLDFYKAWKQWLLAGNKRFPPALRSDGGSPLSSIINQGSYIFLNNTAGWRIKPPEENITIYFTGNLAVESTALPAFIPTTGAFTAAILGLQPVTQGVTPVMAEQLEYAGFEGGVSIDATDGVSGTGNVNGIPIGTPSLPVNNTTDALTIANDRGLRKLYVKGALTLSGTSFNGYEIFGNGAFITISGISFARFHDCYVSGSCGMRTWFTDCAIGNMTCSASGATVHFMHTAFAGTLTMNVVNLIITEGVSAVSGEAEAVFDFNSTASSMEVRGYTGGIQLINKNGAQTTTIDMTSGHVMLDSTVTNGTIVLRGQANVEDNSTGTSIVKKHALMNPSNITSTTNALIEGIRGHHTGTGNVFFWNPEDGDDLLDGTSRSTARKTFASIHDNLVLDGNHDVVIAIDTPGGTEPDGTTATDEQIHITKRFVFVRGPGRGFMVRTTDKPAVIIDAAGCEVSSMRVNTLGTNNDCIQVNAGFPLMRWLWMDACSGNGVVFANCAYGYLQNSYIRGMTGHGVKIGSGCNHLWLEDNGVHGAGGDGLRIEGSSAYEIKITGKTDIHYCTGYGINIVSGGSLTRISKEVTLESNTAGRINDPGNKHVWEGDVFADHQNAEIAEVVWARALDGLTAEQIMKVTLAALAGKRSGIGTATETYFGNDGITPVITLTPDQYGNGQPVVTP